MNVTAIIPARAGSKRLPGKNWRDLCGRPLTDWTIDCALECAAVDSVLVTTDCAELADHTEDRRRLVHVHWRSAALSEDSTPMADVIADVVDNIDGAAVLLQPTSPLRKPCDITNCVIELLRGADTAATVCGNRMNGAVYAFTRSWFDHSGQIVGGKCVLVEMPPHRSVDIDTLEDFERAERWMKERLAGND